MERNEILSRLTALDFMALDMALFLDINPENKDAIAIYNEVLKEAEWDLTINFVSNHPELNPTGTWNLSKRYNLVKKLPEFLEYEKKELANEFLSSMTLFDV